MKIYHQMPLRDAEEGIRVEETEIPEGWKKIQ
jgi:hypothetical protein